MYLSRYKEHNHIGDAGAAIICRGNWPYLKILDISSNNLTIYTAKMLITANWTHLKILLIGYLLLIQPKTVSINRDFAVLPYQYGENWPQFEYVCIL
jgi:hypothetical protein